MLQVSLYYHTAQLLFNFLKRGWAYFFKIIFICLYFVFNVFFILGCTLNARIYEINSKPIPIKIANISPNSSFFLGGEKITVTGSGFRQGISVYIDEKECADLSIINSESLTCTIPKFDTLNLFSNSKSVGQKILKMNSSNKLNITIRSADGAQGSLPEAFQYKSDAFTKVELFSGSLSKSGRSNGIAENIKFYRPSKPVIHNGYMYVSDTGNQLIRRIDMSTMQSQDFAGKYFQRGSTDGIGANATFNDPMGMVAIGNDLYVVENTSCIIRKIDLTTRQVSLFAGQPDNCSAATDAPIGLNAAFTNLSGITTDGNFLYVSDDSANIRKISLSGNNSVTTVNIDPDIFTTIIDITYMNNALYMTEYVDISNFYINKLDLSDGSYSTVLGPTTIRASGITNDGTYLYISISPTHRITKLDLAAPALNPIVGSSIGNIDGIGTAAKLNSPSGLFYYNNEIYFTSYGSHNIRKFHTGTLEVKTILGNTK